MKSYPTCLFAFLAYHISPLVLKSQNASARHHNCVNRALKPTTKRAGLLIKFIGEHRFAARRHQTIVEVMMLIKITGENVKFVGSKVYSRELYKYERT